MDKIPEAVDPWVVKYETLKKELESFGIASEKMEDHCWLNVHLKNICGDRAGPLLKEIENLQRYYE